MRFTTTVAASALIAAASASENYLGFNSGATKADNSAKFKADFQAEFETSANLKGSPGDFNSVRLYTNIQAYSDEDPIEAFDAAVETKTKILLGVWASGTTSIQKEINALKKGIDKYGSKLTDLVIGVNIGSEDLYRTSVTGVKNDPDGVGNSPKALVGFINDWRSAFKNTALSKIPVGHADTWDVWGNSTNKPVLDAIDFLSVHEYPYYENGKGNDIGNAAKLFQTAYQNTIDAAGGKPVWVTETGWPYVGPDWDQAVASTDNAKTYWDEVGCKKLFHKTPTFWYTLRDSNPANKMKFAITDNLSTTPRFDLSCDKLEDDDDDKKSTTKSGSHSATGTATGTPTGTPTGTATASATPSASSGAGNNNSNGGHGGNGSNSTAPSSTQSGASPSQSGDKPAAAPGLQLFSTFTYGALAVVGAAFAML